MNKPNFSLCVYCGSRMGDLPAYAQAARDVGSWIGRHGGQLVYGGGNNGLMGVVAQATAQAGGRVVGVIPQALVDKEFARRECDELHVVQTMHERKQMMAERADAFLTLPGGIGTLEELFEIWSWRQLGYHHKPLGMLSVNGYYDGMMAFLSQATQNGFIGEAPQKLVRLDSETDRLLKTLVSEAGMRPEGSGLELI
ncbi:MAG: TIGR00730 family Rossman fold protein [Betaproteobacteria bacterium]|nr:TIGR00730 family Rossman fold protein [Betaproteobacteria bacterium]NBY04381.1 TIGR00730 family Rossman fold protein [Betaproteobacteria bacterium]